VVEDEVEAVVVMLIATGIAVEIVIGLDLIVATVMDHAVAIFTIIGGLFTQIIMCQLPQLPLCH
jgi:hypothetical protein